MMFILEMWKCGKCGNLRPAQITKLPDFQISKSNVSPRRRVRARLLTRTRGPVLHDAARGPRRPGRQDRTARAAATTRARGDRRLSAARVRISSVSTGTRRVSRWISSTSARGRSSTRCSRARTSSSKTSGRGRWRDWGSASRTSRPNIHGSSTAPSQDSARRDRGGPRPGYDAMIQAEGGLMSITGAPDGPPFRLGVAIGDIATGMFAVQGILAALLARERRLRPGAGRDGGGQHVDIAMLDAVTALLTYQASSVFATGDTPGRLGNRHPSIAPYDTFAAVRRRLRVVGRQRRPVPPPVAGPRPIRSWRPIRASRTMPIAWRITSASAEGIVGASSARGRDRSGCRR